MSNSHAKACKKYEKTKAGFLMRLYRNMTSRVTGIQKGKHYLYKGKGLLEKEKFYDWANEQKEFHTIFKKWEESNYDRKLTPSVDRIELREEYKGIWGQKSAMARKYGLSKSTVINAINKKYWKHVV